MYPLTSYTVDQAINGYASQMQRTIVMMTYAINTNDSKLFKKMNLRYLGQKECLRSVITN